MRHRVRAVHPAALLALLVLPSGAQPGAAQEQVPQPSSANPIEASQIELPATGTPARPGRAYLDEVGRPVSPSIARAELVGDAAARISHADGSTPPSQITASGHGGPGIAQLSAADLDATLAQLSAGERRVLLEAIAGTDICDHPPPVAAIMALCQNRIETRAGEFTARAEHPLSAEDRLLRGDLESSALPNIARVIERLARSGASSGDLSNQAIAAIALGTNGAVPDDGTRKDGAAQPQLTEQTQSLINALVSQLGGNAP